MESQNFLLELIFKKKKNAPTQPNPIWSLWVGLGSIQEHRSGFKKILEKKKKKKKNPQIQSNTNLTRP